MAHTSPDLFILGAPKCGTSRLYSILAQHPDIFMPEIKEPNYFATDIPKARHISDEKAYYKLFEGKSEKIKAEASTIYFHSDAAVKNIKSANPNAKFVIILRNPIEMAFSLFHQQRFSLHEPLSEFEQAWAESPMRWETGKASQMHYNPIAVCYAQASRLGTYTQARLLECGEDNLKIIFLDDLKRDFVTHYTDLLLFLGLSYDGQQSFGAVETAKVREVSALKKMLINPPGILKSLKRGVKKTFKIHNSKAGKLLYQSTLKTVSEKPQLTDDMRKLLLEHLDEEISLIEKIAKRDLSAWRIAK